MEKKSNEKPTHTNLFVLHFNRIIFFNQCTDTRSLELEQEPLIKNPCQPKGLFLACCFVSYRWSQIVQTPPARIWACVCLTHLGAIQHAVRLPLPPSLLASSLTSLVLFVFPPVYLLPRFFSFFSAPSAAFSARVNQHQLALPRRQHEIHFHPVVQWNYKLSLVCAHRKHTSLAPALADDVHALGQPQRSSCMYASAPVL